MLLKRLREEIGFLQYKLCCVQRGYGSEVIDSLPNKIKTIIVPRRLLGADEGVKKYISNLDHEMMSIMKNSTLPLDEKVLKYSQILRRHQNAKQELNKPFKIEVQTNESNDSLLEEGINATVPSKYQKQAHLILKYARDIPNIKWTDNDEMILDGNKIVGSNIVDIINDLARDRKSVPATGTDVLLKHLMEENFPKEMIVNKKRFDLLKKGIGASRKTAGQLVENVIPNWASVLR